MARVLVTHGTCLTRPRRNTTCTWQGLGNDMETSLWLQRVWLGRGLVPAPWQRSA